MYFGQICGRFVSKFSKNIRESLAFFKVLRVYVEFEMMKIKNIHSKVGNKIKTRLELLVATNALITPSQFGLE